jgi:hypothetical protein
VSNNQVRVNVPAAEGEGSRKPAERRGVRQNTERVPHQEGCFSQTSGLSQLTLLIFQPLCCPRTVKKPPLQIAAVGESRM